MDWDAALGMIKTSVTSFVIPVGALGATAWGALKIASGEGNVKTIGSLIVGLGLLVGAAKFVGLF